MATEVKLPELGDGIESGDVLEILVSEGDIISEGQDVIEVETDKATLPVPASAGGKVTRIAVSPGETIAVGGVILEVEASGAGTEETEAPEPQPESEQAEATGQAEAAEQPEAAAEEAEPQAPAEPSAPVQQAPAKPAPPEPAQPAAQRPAPAQKAAASRPAAPPQPAAPQTGAEESDEVVPAGPAIRRFAREVGVNLSNVQGTGTGGRITRDDVLAVVRSASQSAGQSVARPAGGQTAAPQASAPTAQGAAASTPMAGEATDQDEYGPIRVERMSKIRRTIADQMHLSWSTVPRVTNFDDADISDLERLRQSSKEDYAAQGIKLTTMPFLIKAVATALRHHPVVNATIDQENGQLVYKDYVNVGIAVDTDRGLVVPVLKNTDQLGIPDIARKLAETAAKVRGGQFAVNDLRGGTFTISNLGAIGGQYSTPIVNVPEVAILLVGRSRKIPIVMPDDSIQPRLMMPLSLSYDHRLVDGATAARFLNDVIGYLEAPSRLLLAL